MALPIFQMKLSPAEILDKASILKIKIQELPNGEKLAPQLSECFAALSDYPPIRVMDYFNRLARANAVQWVANERIFEALASKEPSEMSKDELFAVVSAFQKANSFNRERVEIKNAITAEFGEGAREEKSYACAL